jgi:hypothetical protein
MGILDPNVAYLDTGPQQAADAHQAASQEAPQGVIGGEVLGKAGNTTGDRSRRLTATAPAPLDNLTSRRMAYRLIRETITHTLPDKAIHEQIAGLGACLLLLVEYHGVSLRKAVGDIAIVMDLEMECNRP